MSSTIKQKVFVLLDPAVGDSKWDRLINGSIILLIILNTGAIILETVDSVYIPNKAIFRVFEIISVIIFSIEFILRVWSITFLEKYNRPVSGRFRYLLSFGALIDLFSILPFYLPLLIGFDLRFLRILRLLRLARFFKLGGYMSASGMIKSVIRSKKEELVLGFAVTFLLIIVASCIMYFVEYEAQPDKFSSIPETMWWSVATLTTVGYGDVYPVTVLGKFLAACISILGIGLFALPAGILASGFSEYFKNKGEENRVCPHCGKKVTP